jgi:hypothetical protein
MVALVESRAKAGRLGRLTALSLAPALAACLSIDPPNAASTSAEPEQHTAAIQVSGGQASSPPAIGAETPAAALRSWLDGQHRRVMAGLDRMRADLDGVAEGARGSVEQAARRIRTRAITASDACFSAEEESCATAAKTACQRASYGDGAPLASVSYVVCSGFWSTRPNAGSCRTKRRLNAALCW